MFLWIFLPLDYVNILVNCIIRYYNLISLKFWQVRIVLMYLKLSNRSLFFKYIMCAGFNWQFMLCQYLPQDIFSMQAYSIVPLIEWKNSSFQTLVHFEFDAWNEIDLKSHAYLYYFLTLILHCVIRWVSFRTLCNLIF